MVKVAPSVLSANFAELKKDLDMIKACGADWIHYDVMDGHFVPNLTIGPVVVKSVAKIATKPLDIHLMVDDNTFFTNLFIPLKPKFLSFHIESENHPLRLIDHIRKNDISPGIVLNPHTEISTLKYIIKEVDLVLLMSVNPGFGGQKFIPSIIEKSRELRELIYKTDGGVNGLNVAELDEAGVDIVVAGNYVFSSQSYKAAITSLKL